MPIQQRMMQPMGMQGFSGMWPPAYNMMHQMMQQSMPIVQPYATPERSSRHMKPFKASSDPPDIAAATIYPPIANFISALAVHFPE